MEPVTSTSLPGHFHHGSTCTAVVLLRGHLRLVLKIICKGRTPQFIKVSVCLCLCPSVRLSVDLSICRSVHLSIYLSIYLSVCLSVCLIVCLSLSVSVCLCLSARLKTKLFCETPTLRCFVHFDFNMCSATRWRAEPTFRPSGAPKH